MKQLLAFKGTDKEFGDYIKKLRKTENELNKTAKYNRKACKNCEYKILCAGECEKTIGG